MGYMIWSESLDEMVLRAFWWHGVKWVWYDPDCLWYDMDTEDALMEIPEDAVPVGHR